MRRNGQQINTLTAGDVMGEKAFVGHTLRTASLVALTRLDVIHFTDEAVRTLCNEMPKFQAELEKAAAAHSQEVTPELQI